MEGPAAAWATDANRLDAVGGMLGVDVRVAGVEEAGVLDPACGLTRCSAEVLPLNIWSIIGRICWPKGVARNSAGRPDISAYIFLIIAHIDLDSPLIQAGIVPPVKNPTTSAVK